MGLGLIGGSGLFESKLIRGSKRKIKTAYGKITVHEKGNIFFIQRHGEQKNIPPHRINHHANILAFMRLDVEDIVGISSVGSLRKDIRPGSIVIPHDYMNFSKVLTYFDESIVHTTPYISEGLRKRIVKAAKKAQVGLIGKGVYVQTQGPRLETKAEINMLKDYADIVGMTMASEATLAKELEMNYAAICSVDNYANGITKYSLDFEEVKKKQKQNFRNIKRIVEAL